MKASSRAMRGSVALALTLVLGGCAARAYEGGGDSNSNWLKACDPDADCGSGLACLCGICTVECASDRTCGDREKASCEVQSGCEQPVAVCTPRVSGDGDADTTAHSTKGHDTTTDEPDAAADYTLPTDTTDGRGTANDSDVDTASDTTTGDTTDGRETTTSPSTTGTNTGPETNTGTGTDTRYVPDTGTRDPNSTATTGTTYIPDTGTIPPGGTTTNPTYVPDTGVTTTNTAGSAPTNTLATNTGETNTTGTFETNTTATGATTTTDVPTAAPILGDFNCGVDACRDGDLCYEPNGQHCECSLRDVLESCDGLAFRTLALPSDLQSCVAHSVSADGNSAVGSCQVVDGPNLATSWGASGGSVVAGVDQAFTQARGISDDALTTYWLGVDGDTFVQTSEGQTVLLDEDAVAVTPDGSVVVGNVASGTGLFNVYRWSADTGTQTMQSLGENDDWVSAISADGQTAVGVARKGGVQVPVRWNANGEITELELLDGVSSGYAYDVSADGAVIVGSSGQGHALRWTSAGVELLLETSDINNAAHVVTRDGSRVFGYSLYGAWMWDETNNVQSLEGLLGMDDEWTITNIADVSADGLTVVGSVQLANDFSPWRWFAFTGRLAAP